MCQPASMIVTRTKVLWSKTSDSHEDIIKENALSDGEFVRAEITPPDYRFDAPLDEWNFKVDQDLLPDWFCIQEVELAVRRELPNWLAYKVFTTGHHVIDNGDGWFYGNSTGTVNDGYGRFYGNSTGTVNSGGIGRFYGNSTGTVNSGDGHFYGNSTGTVNSGYGWFYNNSIGTVNDGHGHFYDNSTGTINRGHGHFYDNSTGTVNDGGVVHFYGNSTKK